MRPSYALMTFLLLLLLLILYFVNHRINFSTPKLAFIHRFVQTYDFNKSKVDVTLFRASVNQLFRIYSIPDLPEPKKRYKKLKPFDYIMSKEDRLLFYKLLGIFNRLLRENGVEWFMSSGTLLGSYRIHDILPWDDDIDVFVNFVNRPLIRRLFKTFSKKHFAGQLVLYEAGSHDKLFLNNTSQKLSDYNWKWPYIDVSYYKLNDTHLYDIATTYGRVDTVHKSVVFPLVTRPLFVYNYPSPRDAFAYNVWMYGYTDMCVTNSYSHMLEAGGFSGHKKCASLLRNRYGFVKRNVEKIGGKFTMVETLYWNNSILVQRIPVKEPLYALTEPFALRLTNESIENNQSYSGESWRIPNYLPKSGHKGVSL